jgi:hypothetical protein
MATIQVALQDDRARPVSGASFEFAPAVGDGQTVSADATGRVVFKVSAAGVYTWKASAPGHAPASGQFQILRGRVERAPDVVVLGRLAAASGTAATDVGAALANVGIRAIAAGTGQQSSRQTDAAGLYRFADLTPGSWNLSADTPAGLQPAKRLSIDLKAGDDRRGLDFVFSPIAVPIVTGPAVPSGPDAVMTVESGPAPPVVSGPDVSVPVPPEESVVPPPPGGQTDDPNVAELLRLLDTPDLAIEQPINEQEAEEAISLFAVSNIVLTVSSRVTVGAAAMRDVLGILALYYGLRDRSMQRRILAKSKTVWLPIQDRLKPLRDRLDVLGSDLVFLEREARRQFNIGWNNDVIGNLRFTVLFNRFVEIASSPLLAQDLRVESVASLDHARVDRAFDLLADLKSVVLSLVRSLSRYGTIATRESNVAWAKVATDALGVLDAIAQERVSDDIDDRNLFAVLADVTGTSREALRPRVVMAKHGAPILRTALDVYRDAKNDLDDLTRDHLLRIFQQGADPEQYRTETLRQHAAVLRRYPVATWR